MGAGGRGPTQPADRRADSGRCCGLSRWPMWRTPPFTKPWPIIKACFYLLVSGPVTLLPVFPDLALRSGSVFDAIAAYCALTFFSPVLVLPGLMFAVPLSLIAARTGYLGWMTTVFCGAIIGLTIAPLLGKAEFVPLLAMFGVLYAVTFWLILLYKSPEVLGLLGNPANSVKN
jgi:hypothetical protein